MEKLINGHTIQEVNQYREDLMEELKYDIEDFKRVGLHDEVSSYEEKIEVLKFAPIHDIAKLMVY